MWQYCGMKGVRWLVVVDKWWLTLVPMQVKRTAWIHGYRVDLRIYVIFSVATPFPAVDHDQIVNFQVREMASPLVIL